MQSTNRIEIVRLLPDTLRSQAATLLYESFYIKMRGNNIGTKIINEIIKYAKENKFNRLKLTVVDTNQGAKKLYERIGFQIAKTVKYGFITRSAGFEAVIHMVKDIS
jgi:RimJ/RimL family protein N-acetyltransferase